MELSEQFILMQAPNPAAAANGRKLSQGGKYSNLCQSADGTVVWADCAGSGKMPYRVSIDWSDPASPVCRCSCPSRQFPCKHALGLMFRQLAGGEFAVAEIPPDLREKRAKQAARAAGKTGAAAPKKPNAAARAKKAAKQLEGLDQAERMVEDLLASGLGALAGQNAQALEKLAKDLGSRYLTGPQTAFEGIALAVREVQARPENARAAYDEALRRLIALRSTLRKGRAFLERKLEAKDFSAEDSVLYEALGGVWKLEELRGLDSCRQDGARLVQLSFDVSFDAVKKEVVERGFWLDLVSGEIGQTLNLRPAKALKYVKAEDSVFQLLETPALYRYPGEGCRRIRWEEAVPRPLTPEERASLPGFAQPDLAAAVKRTKDQIKNTLQPKFLPVLVPVGRMGTVAGQAVLEDPAGCRIVLQDRPEDGPDHATVEFLAMAPGGVPAGSALFGLMFYDGGGRCLCLHPYSVVTAERIVRLLY